MAFALFLVLVSLPLLDAAKVTTLDDVFLQNFNADIHEFTANMLESYINRRRLEVDPNSPYLLPFTEELYEYPKVIEFEIFTEFVRLVAAVPAQSIYDDLNEHCSKYQETPIEDLKVEPKNTSCVQIRLGKMLTSKFKMAVDVGLQQASRQCIGKELSFCSVASRNCTLAYEERMRRILTSFVEDINTVDVVLREAHLYIIMELMARDLHGLFRVFSDVGAAYSSITFLNVCRTCIKPFEVENMLRRWTNKAILEADLQNENNITVSQEQLTWGIIKSNTGKFDILCSYYRDKYSQNSEQFLKFLSTCYFLNLFQSNVLLMRCAYSDPNSRPLIWSTVPSVYFHSQCLCLAYKGEGCRVKAPHGVDPRFYCLSVLFRDFQRQVSYRPAITYLDYAFQTRVPVCKFTNLIEVAFRSDCNDTGASSLIRRIDNVLLMQCYFNDLVNKQMNCSETLIVNSLNHTELCVLRKFMQLVLCDDETDDEARVPYYGAGDSTLVLVLTYVDVAVRVLTLVTYLVCPQLRNLPGKLLIGYQVTALLRLIVVRASLEDLPMAVRLDVAMDLASTLWLTSYLHFLTMSIKTLRLPDSLSPEEVRKVLLRYSLFGWALPTASSAVFFCTDEALHSRVQFGQLCFVLCNYLALFANIYMFFHNCHFYYDVKSSARLFQIGVTARSVFAGLFNFAMKTSVLSGAGITFRLIFTQIQGLEHVLGYYHALGTLQGLLLFFLYGCNREARAFWISVFCSTIHRLSKYP